jgi:hypothetical protein
MAPVKSENNNHGSFVAMVMPEIRTGSLVSRAASSGNAVRNIPSPVHDDVTERRSKRKSLPSDRCWRDTSYFVSLALVFTTQD